MLDWFSVGIGFVGGVAFVVLAVAALVVAAGGLSQGASYGRDRDW